MKKTLIVCLVGMLFFVGSPFVFSAQTEQLLVMAFNDTVSKPWKWKEKEKYVGPFLDVMQEIADRSGVRVVMTPLPWKRVLVKLEAGEIDGFFGGYKNPEREAVAEFLEAPMSWATLAVFVRRGEEFRFEKIEDLHGKRIGVVRGYTTSEDFDRAVKEKKIHAEQVGRYGQMIKMLAAKRVDGVAGAASTIQAHLVDLKLADQFAMLPHPITGPKPIYICVSKKSKTPNRQEIIARMNQAMKEMERENIFEKISQKYGYDKCMVFGCLPKSAAG